MESAGRTSSDGSRSESVDEENLNGRSTATVFWKLDTALWDELLLELREEVPGKTNFEPVPAPAESTLGVSWAGGPSVKITGRLLTVGFTARADSTGAAVGDGGGGGGGGGEGGRTSVSRRSIAGAADAAAAAASVCRACVPGVRSSAIGVDWLAPLSRDGIPGRGWDTTTGGPVGKRGRDRR